MNSVETMTILASIKHEDWKSKILNLKFCNCQVYGGFLVETQQQAPQLLCILFGQTILGNVGQPEIQESTFPDFQHYREHRNRK